MLLDLRLHFLARIGAEIVESVKQRIGARKAEDGCIAERVDDERLTFVVAIKEQPAASAADAGLVAEARAAKHLIPEIGVNVDVFASRPRMPGVVRLRLLVLGAAVAPVALTAV